MLQKRTNIKSENINEKYGFAFEPAVSLIILDTWFDTKPWLIIIFFFVGVVAGILNVIKSAKKLQN